ncbi:MAG: AraC family transcriptional regulator [Saprospiraceae bacterium]|nr:AraC family transcriptional regulator [Saprospiraceae bacterium]
MKDFFKYLNPGEKDKDWGVYLNVAGKATIPPQTIYPSRGHPTGYFYTWKKGRVLDEYQLIYVTEGAGTLENEQGTFGFTSGTMLLIRPREYHRYRPKIESGWVEYYIGFNGHLVNHFYQQAESLRQQAFLHCGIQENFLECYRKIFTFVEEEKLGFQQIASAYVIELLGHLVAFQKQGEFSGKPIEQIIQRALLYMRENVESNLDLQILAAQYHVTYANFRKMFKKYTGMSPRQYHLELKMRRAKELVLTSDKSIMQISEELNFESIHYFSRYFKKKLGYSPTELRKTIS